MKGPAVTGVWVTRLGEPGAVAGVCGRLVVGVRFTERVGVADLGVVGTEAVPLREFPLLFDLPRPWAEGVD